MALPHLDAAYSLAYWIVKNPSDAEDIVQNAYLRAYRGFAGFAGGDIKPWLLTIVRNAAYRWLRDRKRSSNVVSFDEAFQTAPGEEPGESRQPDDSPDPEQILISAGERDRVLAALAKLPEGYREVIVLRELEALSYREIAGVIGAPVGTVMSRLARAREQLRGLLASPIRKEA